MGDGKVLEAHLTLGNCSRAARLQTEVMKVQYPAGLYGAAGRGILLVHYYDPANFATGH